MATQISWAGWLGLCWGLAVFAPAGWQGTLAAEPADENAAAAVSADHVPNAEENARRLEQGVTEGSLRSARKDGSVVDCPLRQTDVRAEVSGFIARVTVKQTFYNPTDERIEAVYVFPLPHESAVDEMTMVVGDRRIVGVIQRRAEARSIYEQALAAGQTAALLEQERPNIFTQSVGNIEPNQQVDIEIRYVDVLAYDMGSYEFHFPMVVGPRFIPGQPTGPPAAVPAELQGRVSPPVADTTRVPDASRISPPVLAPGVRNGHNIALSMSLDAGVPIQGLEVANHKAEVVREGTRAARVTLSPADSIPNKDFVLRYRVVGKKPELAALAHTGITADSRRLGTGFFLLMIQPQEDERLTKSPPREIVFLLDVSGSMSGQPTAKVKEAMRDMLALCREIDTVQVITFASQTQQLFDKPLPVTRENIARALNFTEGIQGGGGTHMLEGVQRAIDQPLDAQRVRIVVMLTDGYIGNEAEIIEHVGKNCGDQVRFWAIGIGSSPNMFLIDGVARQGGGMGKRLGLEDNAAGLSEEVITRIQRAQLAGIRIDWGGLDVAETYPARIPELWAGRPVILFGRYAGGGRATISVRGRVEGEAVEWPLTVELPDQQPAHDVLAKVWARKKIEELMQQTYYAGSPAVEEEVTAIALDYRLMSQYTSFVAVDAREAVAAAEERIAQPPRRMLVPVPLPEGTRWEGFFGPLGETWDEMSSLSLGKKSRSSAGDATTHDYRIKRGRAALAPSSRVRALAFSPDGASLAPTLAAPSAQPGRSLGSAAAASGPAPAMDGLARSDRWARTSGDRAEAEQLVRRSVGHFNAGRGGAVFRGAMPAEASQPAAFGLQLAEVAENASVGVGVWSFAPAAFAAIAEGADALVQPATEKLAAGQRLAAEEKWDAARDQLVQAHLLATAAANRGNTAQDGLAAASLGALEDVHEQRLAQAKRQLAPLGTRLSLVLRDRSVAESLEAIANAAGLTIRLVDGSLEDAASLLESGESRVTYLDLRGATAADALDWLLQPLRLSWQLEGGTQPSIMAGSARRLPGAAAWVYDATAIALLDEQELGTDADAAGAKAREGAERFLAAIRLALGAADSEVNWFAPGQLLVLGDAALQQRAAELLEQLADPAAKPSGPLADLHPLTSRRAQQRREAVGQRVALVRLLLAAQTMEQRTWSLLAAASGDRLDLEALTELQIAWKSAAVARLLDGPGAGIALRSAWAIGLASRSLPEEAELADLAGSVRERVRPAAEQAVAALSEQQQEASALLAAVYGALGQEASPLAASVVSQLPEAPSDPARSAILVAARGLLGEADAAHREQLERLIAARGFAGEDATVLVALACRRHGGETWEAFRAAMRDTLGGQPLTGEVVVLLNHLSGRTVGW